MSVADDNSVISADVTSFNFRPPIHGIVISEDVFVDLVSLVAALRNAGGGSFADQLEEDFRR